jgi:hypothetical protein
MENLITQIREKEKELWHLYLALQELKVKDPSSFRDQDFSRMRESCSQILSLIGNVESRKS